MVSLESFISPWFHVGRSGPAQGNITWGTCDSDGCQSTMLSWFFQWAFCTAGATIVSGAVAERVKGPTYACYAFVMTSCLICSSSLGPCT